MTHMLNLFYLLDVFIPVLHDYGATLKLNDYELFNSVFLRLFLLFLIARDRGEATYRNPMFVYILQTMYWRAKQLPMCDLLTANHTIFSEESGEIALSLLASSQPASTRGSLIDTQRQWQLVHVRSRSCRSRSAQPVRQPKKVRILGKYFLIG
jgi:hypothetical protein